MIETSYALSLPPDLLEAIAQRTAEIIEQRQSESGETRWLYGAEAAADYLGWPVKRVYNRVASKELPAHRSGGRLCFLTSELDRAVRHGG
jgi:excisionase family DNA binding protein